MAVTKRSDAQREADLERVLALYLSGETQRAIGETLGLSQQQISYDLTEIRKRARERCGRRIEDELAKVDAVEHEHWQAWEKGHDKDHLAGVLACVKERCKLLGHYAPEKLDVIGGTKIVLKWGDSEPVHANRGSGAAAALSPPEGD